MHWLLSTLRAMSGGRCQRHHERWVRWSLQLIVLHRPCGALSGTQCGVRSETVEVAETLSRPTSTHRKLCPPSSSVLPELEAAVPVRCNESVTPLLYPLHTAMICRYLTEVSKEIHTALRLKPRYVHAWKMNASRQPLSHLIDSVCASYPRRTRLNGESSQFSSVHE